MNTETKVLEETKFMELYDFPTSWDWWRYYCRMEIADDPGDNNVEVEDENC